MKLEKISYRRLFPTGAYANESIELTGSIGENEDVQNAYNELHKMAEELHYSQNAEMYDQRGTQERIINEPPATGIQAIINDIGTCKDIKVLESYRLIVKNNPELQETYNHKLNQLQNV